MPLGSHHKDFVIGTLFGEWASLRASLEKPLAFISHDLRDEDAIARPLAAELTKFPGCRIWYDEYSLKVGDNLRESIEKEIRTFS